MVEREVEAERAVAYVAFYASVGEWWSADHTYSNDSQNLSIEAKAGGLFRESLPNNGSVKHMEVVFAAPGRSLRMVGGLGPLQEQAVTGVMTITFTESGEGKTKVVLDYRVGGIHSAERRGPTRWTVCCLDDGPLPAIHRHGNPEAGTWSSWRTFRGVFGPRGCYGLERSWGGISGAAGLGF
ncbi:MAG: hypothetical protein R3B96_13235 [Pirellulaceae bacterium]